MSDHSAAAAASATVAAAASRPTDLADILRFLISNCLSYGVVFGASILKVPQILSVLRSHSADGISLAANYMELLSYVISTSWGIVQGLDFRDYGENGFIFVQLLVLVALVARLQKKTRRAVAVVGAELVLFYFFASGYLPRPVHQSLLSGQIGLNISSRVPQILLNYKNGSTGRLSFLTCFLAFGGGLARVLTTAVNVPWEKGKAVLLAQYSIAASLNAIIIGQILYYHYKKATAKSNKSR